MNISHGDLRQILHRCRCCKVLEVLYNIQEDYLNAQKLCYKNFSIVTCQHSGLFSLTNIKINRVTLLLPLALTNSGVKIRLYDLYAYTYTLSLSSAQIHTSVRSLSFISIKKKQKKTKHHQRGSVTGLSTVITA